MRALYTRLSPSQSLTLAPPAAAAETGTPERVRLQPGRLYRVSCDQPIAVRPGAGQPSLTDLYVAPDAPLVFVADVVEISIAARTSAEVTHAWLQEEL